MHEHYSVCPTWDSDRAICQCDKRSLATLICSSVYAIKEAARGKMPTQERLARRRLVFAIQVFESIHHMRFSHYRRAHKNEWRLINGQVHRGKQTDGGGTR